MWFIFVDDLHLDFTETGHLKDLLKTTFAKLVSDRDLAGAVSTGSSFGSSLIAVGLSQDPDGLRRAFKEMSGAALKPSEILGIPARVVYKVDRNDPGYLVDVSYDSSHEVRYRAHVAFATAYGVLKMLAAVPNKHKAIIYVSNGYYFDVWPGARPDATNPFSAAEKTVTLDRLPTVTLERLRDEVAELTVEAKRAGVTIYGIDPRGLSGPPKIDPHLDDVAWQTYWTTTRNSLRVIAEQTGGFVVEDELESGLERIAAAKGR